MLDSTWVSPVFHVAQMMTAKSMELNYELKHLFNSILELITCLGAMR
jgi:hypothetical protein